PKVKVDERTHPVLYLTVSSFGILRPHLLFAKRYVSRMRSGTKKFAGHWSQGLLASMNDPDLIVEKDDKLTVIKDKTDKKIKFRFGYHAVPSMSHLHLHAISQDFDSPSLKTKKHWNSFTSPYFVDSSEVIKRLEKEHKVDFNQKENTEYLSLDLKCHVCGRPMKNMPSLKSHIRTHSYTCDS
ncbi:APTX-like protein, partial [Mya arenaria]